MSAQAGYISSLPRVPAYEPLNPGPFIADRVFIARAASANWATGMVGV